MRSGAGQGVAAGAGGGSWSGLHAWLKTLRASPAATFSAAFEMELAERRLFLWLPVTAGAGVCLYFWAAQQPSLAVAVLLAAGFGVLAFATRNGRLAHFACIGFCALACGFLSAHWRTLRVAAPVLDRVRIVELTGFVEQVDHRREGARLLLRVASAGDLPPAATPYRVRLTTRLTPAVAAGDFIALKARLLPPARAVLPGGYDFARDAYFARIGAVGSVLGKMDRISAPDPPGWPLAIMAAIDQARNSLASRIASVMNGDSGAIAVAMVSGKRDLLPESTRELIREAGIFHIITISGIQMTLVAGIFFWGFRRLLALHPHLALHYPIKKWAAAAAIAGAIAYDVCTGSRVGTERALFMTLIVFAAILCDRQALTMRNLAFAALVVIALEPEAILGVSFQLSFAAVAALVAVYEARMRNLAQHRHAAPPQRRAVGKGDTWLQTVLEAAQHKLSHGIGAALFATFCATSATASFMAYHFHELSPYVLIGNPLTLVIIEVFAVPGALIGAALYPLGLDAPVWLYLGLGIDLVLWAARLIAAAPGATVHLVQFAPWSIVFLSLAVMSAVIWRTALMRATALPLLALGLAGAASGERFDLAIPATGDLAAVRQPDGSVRITGKRNNLFAGEQWLRASGDGSPVSEAASKERCDTIGCTAQMPDGRELAIVLQAEAFAEDCARASIIITPLLAPGGCAAELVFDRRWLAEAGATTLTWHGQTPSIITARANDEDRPWSPRPKSRRPAFSGRGKGAKPGQPQSDGPETADQNNGPWL